MFGKEIAALIENKLWTGNYTVTFGASDLASEAYICKLIAGNIMKQIDDIAQVKCEFLTNSGFCGWVKVSGISALISS
jgi:hypothetical protein